ncbi:MAG: hydroxymethylbilane synthase [Proteobacteria bacterium]|nr:MAG: hydroxymethylbilane synthase [Pseudomonadota bacterium]PIE18064.1 MAG: hydroxymethylbilane synthase [Pseudomonadota bacterium]
MQTVRIATRKSKLALWQAEWVAAQLREAHPRIEVELLHVVTRGDKITDVPLAKVGGKGLFVKEIEDALLEGRADIAVHSIKDVPAELPEGLHLPVLCERADPRDAWCCAAGHELDAMPLGAVIGTSSLRRQVQITARRPDLKIELLRGNVPTRLRKLEEGEYDAIVLAAAGLKRLELAEKATCWLEPELMLPAVGQGAVGIECRQNDEPINALIAPLHHEPTALCVRAERAFLARLDGGCQVPIGCYGVLEGAAVEPAGQTLWLRGLVGDTDRGELLCEERRVVAKEGEAIGVELAEAILAAGGKAILERVYAGGQS